MHLAQRSRWRPGPSLGRLLLGVVFVACQGHPTAADRPPSSISVEAPSEETRLAVAAAAARILPGLEGEFGVGSGHLRIVVDLSSTTETRGGSTSSEGITLFERSLPWLSGVLAHEAVHWLLHWQDSYWNTLPIAIEEGLAQLAFHKYSDTEPPLEEATLDAVSVLSISHEEYNCLQDKRPATYTGALIAQRVGVDRLRRLAMRAREAGETAIPHEWIVQALTEAWRAEVAASDLATGQ